MSEYQKIRFCGAEIIQPGREFSAKPLWQFIAAFVIATNSCPGFAQSGVAEMGAELLNQSPTARRLKDKYTNLVETVEEKKQRIKDRYECSMGNGPLGCTELFGGKHEISKEELDALPREGRELYWQRIGEPKETGLSKAKERIRELAGTWSDSPDSKGTPSSEQSSLPTPGFDAFPGVNLPAGARHACGARRACSDVFKLAAVANGLTNQEPATFAQAERFCNAALVRPETVDAANACTHFYKSRFEQPKQTPDGASEPASGSSTLEAMMDGQKAQDASETDQARQAAARRMQEWEWASAQQRQLQVQEAERQRAQQAQTEAQRANANSDGAAAAAIMMGIIGAAAASGGRAPARAAPSAVAPSAGTPRSAATPYVVVPGGRAGPTGPSSGGGVVRGSSGGSQSGSSSGGSGCAGKQMYGTPPNQWCGTQ